eukprot:CAMPEP_0172897660 /NCGR_PEP_ID=MMETSP1075-20121228/158028_1 /TAXON_ID=2916 /ORGANISM="Ceratium fusus, Strain PA161109" /LENGTH=265 /DNA_ID=CAMNT_0013753285 /DNA_START=12 /DNA_END=806 /DNA_ORIENTATION=+
MTGQGTGVVEQRDGKPMTNWKTAGYELLAYIARELYECMTRLHARGYVHRDINVRNVRVESSSTSTNKKSHWYDCGYSPGSTPDCRITLSGLHLACKQAEAPWTCEAYDEAKHKPPVLDKKNWGPGDDYWSLGLTLYEMWMGLDEQPDALTKIKTKNWPQQGAEWWRTNPQDEQRFNVIQPYLKHKDKDIASHAKSFKNILDLLLDPNPMTRLKNVELVMPDLLAPIVTEGLPHMNRVCADEPCASCASECRANLYELKWECVTP